MENEKSTNKKKALWVILGVVIALALLMAVLMNKTKAPVSTEGEQINTSDEGQVNTGGEGELMDENMDEENIDENFEAIDVEGSNPVLSGAVTQAPGADLITTEGKVVNQEGNEVKTDVAYNSPEAPRQTLAIENEAELATETIKLSINEGKITPDRFTVSAGQAITVALTGEDSSSHVLAFDSNALSAVYINTRAGETRAVTFNAPSEPGEYIYFCDFPGHRGRGEQGVMVVK